MMPHIVPFDEVNVIADQPWLTPEEHEKAKMIGDMMIQEISLSGDEPWMIPHLKAMAEQGDKEAIRKLHPLSHFILTIDYRIVQEINTYRWGMFLEKGLHRMIERTDICKGKERDHFSRSDNPSWAQQHERKIQTPPKMEETNVSTVFIGCVEDELFETMIFGGWYGSVPWRSATLIDAKKCHFEAVMIARRLNNYLKKYGKARRKDWIRLEKFWQLAEKRGEQWAKKKVDRMQKIADRIDRMPGSPPIPMGNSFYGLAQHIIGRPSLAENPLISALDLFPEEDDG